MEKSKHKDVLINTRGPTYRKIKEEFEAASELEKVNLLIENSSAIKRPLIEVDGALFTVGFDQETYSKLC